MIGEGNKCPVYTGMGNCLHGGEPSWYVTSQPHRSTWLPAVRGMAKC